MGDEKKYPECEKLSAVKDKSQKIGEFLEWLGEKGVELAVRHEHTLVGCLEEDDLDNEDINDLDEDNFVCGYRQDELALYHVTKEKLLAEFFEVDLDKVEKERRAMLEELQNG